MMDQSGLLKNTELGNREDMGIRSGKEHPSSALSNFAPHNFTVDGVACASMEGFLQSLKFKNIDMQKHVCSLVGFKAKSAGKFKNWKDSQTLYWLGKPISRSSGEYQELLDKAFNQLALNPKFQKALLATGDTTITHSLGKRDPSQTVLTEQEFCSRLISLRLKLKS